MTLVAAVLPFVVLVALVLALGRSLAVAAAAAFVTAALVWTLGVGVEASRLAAPVARGLFTALEISLTLLGAIAFLELLQASGRAARIKAALAGFASTEPRVQALLVAWLLCAFLEGAAGFGAPAAVTAPLLVALGFPAVSAATMPLMGDSVAVAFGAVGTPVRIGFAGLPVGATPVLAASVNVVVASIATLAILRVAQGGKLRGGVGLAVFASLCFTLPAFAVSWLGPEFPSIFGALIGLVVFGLAVRGAKPGTGAALRELAAAFAPYGVVCALLLGGKLLLGAERLSFELLGGRYGVAALQPGLVFLAAGFGLWVFDRATRAVPLTAPLAVGARRLPPVAIAIALLAAMAQLIVTFAPGDAAGAGALVLPAPALVALAPLAGALGAFVAGSATVSNLLFAPTLVQAALASGADPAFVLAGQLLGAGAGNMVALQNLAAVQATVGLVDQERTLLARLAPPCAILTAATSLVLVLAYAALR